MLGPYGCALTSTSATPLTEPVVIRVGPVALADSFVRGQRTAEDQVSERVRDFSTTQIWDQWSWVAGGGGLSPAPLRTRRARARRHLRKNRRSISG
jgi:hypothetical protein